MPLFDSNHYHVITPDLIELYEEPVNYFMNRKAVEDALKRVKKNHHIYATERAYQRRVEFWERALELMDGAK